MIKPKLLYSYLVVFILFCLYSFSRTDLNLTLYNLPFLNPFKSLMLNLGYYKRPLATLIFIVLSLVMILLYSVLISKKENYFKNIKIKLTKKHFLIISLTFLVFGLISYPMFSYDIFNYLFNAKMVLVYKLNPHIHTATEFLSDPWTRFMHNTHTAAPYGYSWTIISLLPVFIGLPNFTLSFWLMKLLITSFFFLEIYLFYLLAKESTPNQKLKRTAMLALNPLLLIETFINGHNDSLMIALAFASVYFLFKKTSIKNILLSIFFWTTSVLIKYATVVLLPLLIFSKKIKNHFYEYAGTFLLLILLSRPGQLNSWYLHWGIAFLLLSRSSFFVTLALLLSFGGLLRYAPFIYYGNWDYPVTLIRWIVLLSPLILLLVPKIRHVFNQKK